MFQSGSVNEIFDPDRVSSMYQTSPGLRSAAIAADRSTNYGVVRLELLEHIYSDLYTQTLRCGNDEAAMQHQILPHREVLSAKCSTEDGLVRLLVRDLSAAFGRSAHGSVEKLEEMEFDVLVVATGYVRNAHENMLAATRHLLPASSQGKFEVARDYRVLYDVDKVSDDGGVWLQGCNEATHGVSYPYLFYSSKPVLSSHRYLVGQLPSLSPFPSLFLRCVVLQSLGSETIYFKVADICDFS